AATGTANMAIGASGPVTLTAINGSSITANYVSVGTHASTFTSVTLSSNSTLNGLADIGDGGGGFVHAQSGATITPASALYIGGHAATRPLQLTGSSSSMTVSNLTLGSNAVAQAGTGNV